MLLRLTFWHSVNVHIKAQHEATQPIGHTWPHHRHCKQDPCNTKPRLGHSDPGFPPQGSACPMGKSCRSLVLGLGNSPELLGTLTGHMAQRSGPRAPPPPLAPGLLSPHRSLALPQSLSGGASAHQGRGVSCCRGQSRRCRRCQRAGWAHRPHRAGSVPRTLSPPWPDAGSLWSLSSCHWRGLELGSGPRLWADTGKPRNPVARPLRDDKKYYDYS